MMPELKPATIAVIPIAITIIAIISSISPNPPSCASRSRKGRQFATTANVGVAIERETGSDQVIVWLPLAAPLRPRTRYHQLPGLSGRIAEVAYVLSDPTVRHGFSERLHCTS